MALGITSLTPFGKHPFPVPAVIFGIATGSSRRSPALGPPSHGGRTGGFLLAADTAFGFLKRLRRLGDVSSKWPIGQTVAKIIENPTPASQPGAMLTNRL